MRFGVHLEPIQFTLNLLVRGEHHEIWDGDTTGHIEHEHHRVGDILGSHTAARGDLLLDARVAIDHTPESIENDARCDRSQSHAATDQLHPDFDGRHRRCGVSNRHRCHLESGSKAGARATTEFAGQALCVAKNP